MYEFYESDFKAPVKLWLPLDEVEPGALDQLRNAARHPEVTPRVAVMPDCHIGYGVTIGCVLPTSESVIPNAVGVDIGCGMCALDTGVAYDRGRMDRGFWRAWAGQVVRDVPNGFKSHARPQDLGELDRPLRAASLQPLVHDKAAVQLGTLGGGNHFMEAQVAEDGTIWLMVHSGSRHTGLRIADFYNQKAIESTERRTLPVRNDLASLRTDEPDGDDYLQDMQWAADFALASRRQMMTRMAAALAKALGKALDDDAFVDLPDDRFINIHHNFAKVEVVDGEEVVVHRKGATSAYAGELGIIPGSMGANSYIVRGLGNPDSLQSCSHGAGRRMGRNVAKQTISEADFVKSLEGTYFQGVDVLRGRSPARLQEHREGDRSPAGSDRHRTHPQSDHHRQG